MPTEAEALANLNRLVLQSIVRAFGADACYLVESTESGRIARVFRSFTHWGEGRSVVDARGTTEQEALINLYEYLKN